VLINALFLQTALYLRFQAKHPDILIRERSFVKFLPFYVKPLKDRNVCCCRYHVELDMLREGINYMRDARKGVHATCTCRCQVCAHSSNDEGVSCGAHEVVFKGITKLWQEVVCPKLETKEWYKYDCLMGQCLECENLPLCPNELNGRKNALVKWPCFQSEVIGTRLDGQVKKKIKEVFMETSAMEFLHFLKPKLVKFVIHNFVARWQDR
jgi:hypothetical protein